MTTQLTLPFNPSPSVAAADFHIGRANRAAFELIGRWPDWPSQVVVLVGPEASGKSHLAAIMAETLPARIETASTIDWSGVAAELEHDNGIRLLIVEDTGPGLDEPGLFHLINSVLGTRMTLLLTARSLPGEWKLTLPDLVSRLRAAIPVIIESPDDTLLEAILAKHVADRQTVVDPAVIRYSVSRMERSYVAALRLIAELDSAAVARRSAITRALAADVLAASWREPFLPGLDGDRMD